MRLSRIANNHSPARAPTMVGGTSNFSSSHTTCRRSRITRITNSTNTSRLHSGTANCSGITKASSGTAIMPAPKPDMPRITNAKKKTPTIHASWNPLSPDMASLEHQCRAADQQHGAHRAGEQQVVDPAYHARTQPGADDHRRQGRREQRQRLPVIQTERCVTGDARQSLEQHDGGD